MRDHRVQSELSSGKSRDVRSTPCDRRTAPAVFHEPPLVVFTTLATAGAGILASTLIRPLVGAPVGLRPIDSGMGAILIGTGFVFSTAHLGRKTRALLAIRRFGRSPLSTEVALGALLFMAAAAESMAMKMRFSVPPLDWFVAAVAVAFLVALGFVYRLPGQVGWGFGSIASPLASGVLSGSVWHLAMRTAAGTEGGPSFAPLVLATGADLVILAARWQSVDAARGRGSPVYSKAFALRHPIFGARLAILDLLAPLLALIDARFVGLAAVLAGLVLDRFAFYALAVRETVEGEIEQVEAVIAGRG
ncbi:MAG: DmsC/YnfH family molybdoenzyme membrane anchor subunit [Vicinamibacterales bacterium]